MLHITCYNRCCYATVFLTYRAAGEQVYTAGVPETPAINVWGPVDDGLPFPGDVLLWLTQRGKAACLSLHVFAFHPQLIVRAEFLHTSWSPRACFFAAMDWYKEAHEMSSCSHPPSSAAECEQTTVAHSSIHSFAVQAGVVLRACWPRELPGLTQA
jgi:hypothetical protein